MISRTPNVLLVDDDENILSSITREFHHLDLELELITTSNPESAMKIMQDTRIDVIVADECMKGIKGTELLKWVAENYPNTARLILTGQPSVPSMKYAINESRVSKYLLKPIRACDLAKAIMDSLPNRVKRVFSIRRN